MFFIFWRGKGFIALLAAMAFSLVSAIINGAFKFTTSDPETYVVTAVVAAAIFLPLWNYGKKINSQITTLVDKSTGQEYTLKNSHSLFWIPVQYWAIIWPILFIIIFAQTMLAGPK
jgi:hypothetical protein